MRLNKAYRYPEENKLAIVQLKKFTTGLDYMKNPKELTFKIPLRGTPSEYVKIEKEVKIEDTPGFPISIDHKMFFTKVFEPVHDEYVTKFNKTLSVIGDKPWFIMFYTDKCGYCEPFKPIWKEFNLKHNETLNIGVVHCD